MHVSDMQEKKNKRLFILFCVLCCLTVTAFIVGRSKGSVDVDKDIFRQYDTRDIDHVVMESPQGAVSLKYNGARWQVNDQYDADTQMIQVLFATLDQAEPKRALSASMQDSINTVLRQKGVKVTLRTGDDTKAVFYAGGNPQKTQAYFADEGGTAYLMAIPGYRVYTSGIFELKEKDWKNKYVFSFNWRNFKNLEARFPQRTADNFSVVQAENYFTISNLASVDTAKLNEYLDKVSLLTVQEYVDEELVSSATTPTLEISIGDIANRVYKLELYPDLGENNGRIPGRIDAKQWAWFDRARVLELYRPRQFFSQ